MRMTKFDCIAMKREGSLKVSQRLAGMTLDEQLAFWQAGTTRLTQCQEKLLLQEISRFLGVWHLIPEQSAYEVGTPPLSGQYQIVQNGIELTFTMMWVDEAGQEQATSHIERCDGRFYPYNNPAIADDRCLKLRHERLLESLVRKDGALVLATIRELLVDSRLKVTIAGVLESEQIYRNISFYRR